MLRAALLLLALTLAAPAPAQTTDPATLILYRGKGYEGIVNPFVRPWAYLDGGLCAGAVGRALRLAEYLCHCECGSLVRSRSSGNAP